MTAFTDWMVSDVKHMVMVLVPVWIGALAYVYFGIRAHLREKTKKK